MKPLGVDILADRYQLSMIKCSYFFSLSCPQNEEISKHIRKAIKKEKLEKEYKLHVGCDISSQNRILKRISSNKNRYHIVSQLRAKHLDKIDELDNEEAEAIKKDDETEEEESSEKKEKIFCLYDMEQNVISNKVRAFIIIIITSCLCKMLYNRLTLLNVLKFTFTLIILHKR